MTRSVIGKTGFFGCLISLWLVSFAFGQLCRASRSQKSRWRDLRTRPRFTGEQAFRRAWSRSTEYSQVIR